MTTCDTPSLGNVIFEGNAIRFDREDCTQCHRVDLSFYNTLGKWQVQDAWSNVVNKWWDKEVKDLYLQTKEFLGITERYALERMCGQQCGPQVLSNGIPREQSCKCEAKGLPYCNIEQGRCETQKQQAESKYDCKSEGVFE